MHACIYMNIYTYILYVYIRSIHVGTCFRVFFNAMATQIEFDRHRNVRSDCIQFQNYDVRSRRVAN